MRFSAIIIALMLLALGSLQAQEAPKSFLGADVADLTMQEAAKFGWETPRGAKVVGVAQGSPAAEAGLQPGDVLEIVDKQAIDGKTDFDKAIGGKTPGAQVKLRLLRNGKEKTISVTIIAQPAEAAAIEDDPQPMLDAGGHIAKLNELVFTPDSKQLVSASDDKTIRVWDMETGKTVRFIRGQVGPGIEGEIFTIALSPDGRWLAAGGWFGKDSTSTTCCGDIRLYEFATGELVALLKGHESRTLRLAFSSDSKKLISGSRDTTAIIWDVASRTPLVHLNGHRKELLAVGFSPDGSRAVTGSFDGTLKTWDAASGQQLTEAAWDGNAKLPEYDMHITEPLARSLDGRWFAEASGADIVITNASDGKEAKRFKGAGAPIKAVAFSADGRTIAWSTAQSPPATNGRASYAYQLRLPLEGTVLLGGPLGISEEDAGKSWAGVILKDASWSLGHSKGGEYGASNAILEIANAGSVVARVERGPTEGYGHSSYSFVPGDEAIISGGPTGVLVAYGRDGKETSGFVGHEGDVDAIAPSPDGHMLVSGAADRTVRLWNVKTRELIATLFQASEADWVMWTPQGYYAASGPGAELIGWQINHGADHEAEYVNAAQLRKSLNRPDIVTRAIQLGSAKAAVKEANGTKFKLADLLAKPVPRLRIVSPAANATVKGGNAEVEIALDATPDPVKAVRVQVNGRQVAEEQPEVGGGFRPGAYKLPVPLSAGSNAIRVIAVNDTGESSTDIVVTHDGPGDLDKRGTLYILAIGVTKYPHLGTACHELDGITRKSCDLAAPGADAQVFAKTMAARLGSHHAKVVSRVLVNGGDPADSPTAANILDALGMLRDANPADTVLLFLSGHGMNEGLTYNFLATDAAFSGNALRNSTVVPWANLQIAIEAAKGRRILFVDTCHAGNSYNHRLGNDTYQANIIVYSAARWDQAALERGDLGHGLFTLALVEGVNGAAKDKTGEVRAEGLRDFVRRRVQELAKPLKQEQEPQYFRGRDAENSLLVRGQ